MASFLRRDIFQVRVCVTDYTSLSCSDPAHTIHSADTFYYYFYDVSVAGLQIKDQMMQVQSQSAGAGARRGEARWCE